MIIKKNTVNTCIFTLAEKTTLDPVYYLFEFVNDSTKDSFTFLAEDISTNKLRFNEFEIEETESEDRLNGKIYLELLGSYSYNIYEQSSTDNLDTSLATNLVETGKIDVEQDATELATFESTSTIKVFNE